MITRRRQCTGVGLVRLGPVWRVVGHDNVWLTKFWPGKIGVLPAGSSTITDFLIPTPRCGPEDITLAADGSIYFTERYGNKIGQISVSGLTAR